MDSFEIHDTYDEAPQKVDGKVVRLRIAHMTVDEYMAFDISMQRWRRMGACRVPTRVVGSDEMAEVPVMTTVDLAGKPLDAPVQAQDPTTGKPLTRLAMSDNEVQLRRLREMTPDQREAWEIVNERDELWARKFVLDTLRQYVTVEPGDLEGVTTGEELVRYCHNQRGVLHETLSDVLLLNSLTPGQKKALQSLRASRSGSPSSSVPAPTDSGDGPAPTAAPAGAPGFASSEAAATA